jgi:hypothetical protein
MVSVLLTPLEEAHIIRAAHQAGMSRSTWARRALLEKLKGGLPQTLSDTKT